MNDKKKPWRESEEAVEQVVAPAPVVPKPGVNYEPPKPKSYEPPAVEAKPIENIAGYSAEFLDSVSTRLLHGDSTGLANRNASFIAAVTSRSLFDLNKRLKKLEKALE